MGAILLAFVWFGVCSVILVYLEGYSVTKFLALVDAVVFTIALWGHSAEFACVWLVVCGVVLVYLGGYSVTRFLAVVGTVILTAVLWGYSEKPGPDNPKRWGLFGYKEIQTLPREFVPQHHPEAIPHPDARGTGLYVYWPKKGWYNAPQFVATIALTAFMWWAVGSLVWRRGSNPVGINPAVH